MTADIYKNPEPQKEANRPGESSRVATGIPGLDMILGGGLLSGRMYMLEGHAGTGKTTLALQFLLAGRDQHERCMLVTTSETRDELLISAQSHGWSLENIHVLELALTDSLSYPLQQQTVFRPSQVELDETMQMIISQLEQIQPDRIVFDSIAILRVMADEPLAYRRHVLFLKNVLLMSHCTALVLDEMVDAEDLHLRTLSHGVIQLLRENIEFGKEKRQLVILKMRGMAFQSGKHDFIIRTGGIQVFPHLVIEGRMMDYGSEVLSTGLERLDNLLGGGLDRGNATLFVGTAGTGKSSVTMQCIAAALQRQQSVMGFLFDERPHVWLHRAEQLGFHLRQQVSEGRLSLYHFNPAEVSPGQFAYEVQQAVIGKQAQLVIIDSLTGYLNAMQEERFLTLHMHELLTWLGQQGVTSLLVVEQHGMLEFQRTLSLNLSYLADTVLLFRYYEHRGTIHRAIVVVKRRGGAHEPTMHEITLGAQGITIGQPLIKLQGVFPGILSYQGAEESGHSK